MIQIVVACSVVLCWIPTCAQKTNEVWEIQHHASKASFRGLFVVDEKVVWVSGSKNTVLRSVDGGKNWQSVGPTIDEELDFRDVHAFDENRAIILSAGAPARVYRTADGGKNWEMVFEDAREAAFFDAMSFWDENRGIAFSDPIDGRLLLIGTEDGGKSWNELPKSQQPQTLEGEAGFAASGTCLCIFEDRLFVGLGGKRTEQQPVGARVLVSKDHGKTWRAVGVPMNSGEASGVFSIAFANRDHGVAVGGTYTEPDDTTNNICITDDGGETWKLPDSKPSGYRSCVAVGHFEGKSQLICVGRNGSDVSEDFGKNWQPLDAEPFYSIAFSANGKTGVAVAGEGKIGIWRR